MKARIGVAGAGFSGAVIAQQLAKAGYKVHVFDQRPHLAGNAHTQRDPETGIMLHVYGPHIFHTSSEKVWSFVTELDQFMPFTNRVKAVAQGCVYSLPINLHTINQFFGQTFSPSEAAKFIASRTESGTGEPSHFEDQALRMIGRELYEAFFKGYTLKQWGVDPKTLPASILKRLPIRFNYEDNYYPSRFQGMPRHGYTHLVEKLLDHPNIKVALNTHFSREMTKDFDHVFISAPIDHWFGHSEGKLSYRTLDFAREKFEGDFQGNAVINYCDRQVAWTRISEHKHFSPWETHDASIIFKEYSRDCEEGDTPYYPRRLAKDLDLLNRYVTLARQEKGVTFVGRLGTYRYLDMHIAISEALDTSERFIQAQCQGQTMPTFVVDPLA